jgi:hypothetical protein
MTRPRRSAWSLVSTLLVALLSVTPAVAADWTNIPLKNWGGFAVTRDALYDDLERLVASGLAGPAILNTKPLSRTEAARIVAGAIERIRANDPGVDNSRSDLEPVLERLATELAPELVALGVRWNGVAPRPPTFWIPVDRAQGRAGYASHRRTLVNTQGLTLGEGFSTGFTFETRGGLADVVTVYLQPEAELDEAAASLRLHTGYVKLTHSNVELLIGRDSLWWGPGLNGSLIFSNNAPPLDQIRLATAEPVRLPWIGAWLGPTKALFFLAQLEEDREDPHAKLAGMRLTFSPVPGLEIGLSRAVMFDGRRRPRLEVENYPRVIFVPGVGDDPVREAKFRNNSVFAIDAELRLSNVDRYLVPARDLRLYGEFGWDDTCCNSNFIPLRDAISGLLGVHLLGVFGREGLEARAEYARSSIQSFRHSQFTDGYVTRGSVISHFMGTEGDAYLARVTNRLGPNAMLGLELHRSVVGATAAGFGRPRERRTGGSIDVSYRWEQYGVFAQYRALDVVNRHFRSGVNGLEHLLRLELTRSFR